MTYLFKCLHIATLTWLLVVAAGTRVEALSTTNLAENLTGQSESDETKLEKFALQESIPLLFFSSRTSALEVTFPKVEKQKQDEQINALGAKNKKSKSQYCRALAAYLNGNFMLATRKFAIALASPTTKTNRQTLLYLLAVADIKCKKFEAACDNLNQAIVLQSDQPNYHFALSEALSFRSKLAGASTELTKAFALLKSKPSDSQSSAKRLTQAYFHLSQSSLDFKKSNCNAAVANCRKAIDACDQILLVEPDNFSAQINKSLAFEWSADAQNELGNYNVALSMVDRAEAINETLLIQNPTSRILNGSKVRTLIDRARARVMLGQLDRAIEGYSLAEARNKQVLASEPHLISALTTQGIIYFSLNTVHSLKKEYKEAYENAKLMLKCFKKLQKLAPAESSSYQQEARALQTLALTHLLLHKPLRAMLTSLSAISKAELALSCDPENEVAMFRMGECLAFRAYLLKRQNRTAAALENYHQAIICYEKSIAKRPLDLDTNRSKIIATLKVANLQAKLGSTIAAQKSCLSVIEQTARLDQLAPLRANSSPRLSETYNLLGTIENKNGHTEEALKYFDKAVAASDEFFKARPFMTTSFYDKASALRDKGLLQTKLGQEENAQASYLQALSTCDVWLKQSPNNVLAVLTQINLRNLLKKPTEH